MSAVAVAACGSAAAPTPSTPGDIVPASTPTPRPVMTLPPDVLASIRIDGGPLLLADGSGSIWVATHRDSKLYRIDPATNQVTATVDVGQESCGLFAAFDRLWVTPCSEGPGGGMTIVDPSTNQVVGSITDGALQPAAGDGSLWVIAGGGPPAPSEVVRVDPATLKTVATIKVGSGAEDVAFGAGSVWSGNGWDGTVSRIDPATNRVVATISAGLPRSEMNLTFAFGAVWASPLSSTAADYSRLWRIDPATNDVSQTVVPGAQDQSADAGSIAAGLGGLFVSTADETITRLDPTSLKATATYHRDSSGAVLVAYGSLWVTNVDSLTVWRIRLPS